MFHDALYMYTILTQLELIDLDVYKDQGSCEWIDRRTDLA